MELVLTCLLGLFCFGFWVGYKFAYFEVEALDLKTKTKKKNVAFTKPGIW